MAVIENWRGGAISGDAYRMKLTGPPCTEARSGVEEAGRRERAEDSAGGVRVELGVRPELTEVSLYLCG